ncbi:hypothetical protein FAZ95_39010 [Trinickia violacea]|uniref:Type VI secretion protein n=1 Tax=Trinickia violacea TaxID=2571746 RepID=A0A4P8J298_9BURK|nr:type IV secretion system protein [Trinickia violacea]QCP55121.1 hypothetical protein FAZ95_39010 [Trinickia violacea]
MKRQGVQCHIAAALLCGAVQIAFAQGVPVGNATEQAQLQVSLTQQLAQIGQLAQQIDQMKQQYSAITGSYARGAQGLTSAITSSSVVPGSWQAVVAQQQSGAYASLQAPYEKVMNSLSPSSFSDASQGATYQLNTDSTRAGLTMSEALYNEAQTHLNNFEQLAQQVDTTANVKDAADLQNRMTAELGMAQAAQTKLQALGARLQAAQLNSSNQADAVRARFFNQTQGTTQ